MECCGVGGFAEFGLTVEPIDTVVVDGRPLTLDCVVHYANDTETHAVSVQWLKDAQLMALSPPHKYEVHSLLLLSSCNFIKTSKGMCRS